MRDIAERADREKEKKAAEKKSEDKKSEDKKQNEKKPDDKPMPPQSGQGSANNETHEVDSALVSARGAL